MQWIGGALVRDLSKGLNEGDFKLLTAQTRACIYVLVFMFAAVSDLV